MQGDQPRHPLDLRLGVAQTGHDLLRHARAHVGVAVHVPLFLHAPALGYVVQKRDKAHSLGGVFHRFDDVLVHGEFMEALVLLYADILAKFRQDYRHCAAIYKSAERRAHVLAGEQFIQLHAYAFGGDVIKQGAFFACGARRALLRVETQYGYEAI